MVHIVHPLELGANTIQVRTVDTVVVVIFVGTFHDLIATSFGKDMVVYTSEKIQVFPHKLHLYKLGQSKSRALPVLHAFSGCDTTSALNGKDKTSVWQAWHVYEEIIETFVSLSCNPSQLLDVNDDHFKRSKVSCYPV